MSQALPKRHFQTFARLRPASSSDISALEALQDHCPQAFGKLEWSKLVASDDAIAITAHEGASLVGAAVVTHRANTATAKLLWLSVCPSARSRGVGTLLLDAATSAARDGGAAVVVAVTPLEDGHISNLLLAGSFERRSTDARTAFYKRVLWPRQDAENVIRVSFA